MGFLDKLKLTGDSSGGTEAPPLPPTQKGSTQKPSSDLPPLPGKSSGIQQSTKKDLPPPIRPLSDEQSEAQEDSKAQQPKEKPVSAPQPPSDKEMEELKKHAAQKKSPTPAPPPQSQPVSQPQKETQNAVPPPPAPQNKSRERSMRSVSDMPPIKVDGASDSQQGIITDRHVKELDVDNLVLPGTKQDSIVQAPIAPQQQQPPPKQPSREPPRQQQPPPQQSSHQPQEEPRQQLPQQPMPAPQPRPQPSHQGSGERAYLGPLYVDVPTYEEVQEHLRVLRQDLASVTNDVDTIDRLNKKETEEFASLVERLESIQDRVLGIDKSLFEEK